MTRLIGLLRGVNVGGKSKLSMSALRELVEGLGYTHVQTHLQSGNVVFTSNDHTETAARKIEAALQCDLGLSSAVVLRTRDELVDVIERSLLADVASAPEHYVVFFLSEAPDPKRLASIDPSAFAPDVFRPSGREIYAWFPEGMGRSRLLSALSDKRLGVVATARNWKTVTALLRIADSHS